MSEQKKIDPLHKKNRISHKKSEIVCRCNNVSRETIENAILEGCDTLNKIFDATTAGVGPCGGSCRKKIGPFLQDYLECGQFPEKIKEFRQLKKE